jgi:5-methyltetrahydrofolate--homocysteine methyltransferase
MEYILNEGLKQADSDVHALDVNVGLPEIDEPAMIYEAVKALQAVTDLPLQIDTSDPVALEKAMRIYNGKPLVNSVNGKQAVMDKVFPLIQKYGGAVVALTIGEEGIPEDAEGRLKIALDIIREAEKYGIPKKDIIVDPLAMAISSIQSSANTALEVVRELNRQGVRTIMGVSNISFGLPKRDLINSVFFANAMSAGLNCAIMNPFSVPMMDAYHAFRALSAKDLNCLDYIQYTEERAEPSPSLVTAETKPSPGGEGGSRGLTDEGSQNDLKQSIVSGMTEKAVRLTGELLQTAEPLEIINGHIVPALDEVGKAFEAGKIYLPQLLMSADSAAGAFEKVKEKLPASDEDRGRMVILATVQGDVHDIGKNIVKVLLQSYGFYVMDLGKDVAPETIRDAALENGCKLVGLSALMTTTVPAMEETIKLIREADPAIKVMVGGAVLTQEYADKIGADRYSPDAMDAVRYAEEFYNQ